jgi:sugar transferase (PEP-CTERM/EpsH1 system associated)
MADWVDTTLHDRNVASIVAYSSPMGQYVLGPRREDYRRIMDFVDVDSDKWRQYAEGKSWPMSWIYNREAKRLLDFEKQVAREFDASVFVTSYEVNLFDRLAPETSRKHFAVANGVATDYFDPAIEFENPYSECTLPIVFTGMMDYWANIDAVSWFSRKVFPGIRSRVSNAEFWIVGASPTKDVLALDSLDGVHVTGRVTDVRPYLKHAKLAVAPLRIARGIQNKVLEALAMGCPVLCTSHAATGLQQSATMPVTVLDDATDLAAAATSFLEGGEIETVHQAARRYTLDHCDWAQNLAQFERIHMGITRA